MDIKAEIEKCVRLYTAHANLNIDDIVKGIDDNDSSFHGTLGEYKNSTDLRKCIELYKEGELDASYYYIVHALLEQTGSLHFNQYTNVDQFENNVDFLVGIKHIYRPFTNYLQNIYFPKISEEISNVCKCANCDELFTPIDIYNIKKSINSQYLKLYCYNESETKNLTYKFAVKNVVVATDNIDSIFQAKSEHDDAWSIQISLFIEKRNINLSYFIITFAFGNGVYVLTDKPNYKNPDQLDRVSRRNGGLRFSEGREESNYLPYILIDKVLDRRKDNTEVSKKDAKYNELYVFPTEDYFSYNLYFLIKYSIANIIAGNFNQIIKRDVLLLTAGSLDLSNDQFDMKNDDTQRIYDDVYSDIKTTLPAASITDLTAEIEKFPVILTREQFEKDVMYLANKKIADDINLIKYNGLNIHDRYQREDIVRIIYAQEKEINNLIKKNIDKLLPYMFAGDDVYIKQLDNPIEQIPYFLSPNSLKVFSRKFTEGSVSTHVKSVLSNEHATTFMYIQISHYKELMTLLGLKREELPSAFRYYMSHTYMPYIGNSILDNINPLYIMMKNDMASCEYPNGLTFTIPFRKIETNKLYKKYKVSKKTVININNKTCTVDSIVPLKVL